MCEKAPREITEPISILSLVTREAHQKYRAQILYCTLHKRFIGYDYTNCPMCGEEDICEEHWIRLPRQDDLQEMIAEYITQELELAQCSRYELMQSFLDFKAWLGEQYYREDFVCLPTNVFDSGEQLWFAFVMKERHNKTWNGEDWVALITFTGG